MSRQGDGGECDFLLTIVTFLSWQQESSRKVQPYGSYFALYFVLREAAYLVPPPKPPPEKPPPPPNDEPPPPPLELAWCASA